MKKNAISALAFVAILLLIGAALRHFALRSYPLEGPRLLAENRDAKILVVGSSHGMQLSPAHFPEPALNASHPGADLFEVCYKVRYLTERLPAVSQVVIVLSPFSYFIDHATYYRANYHTLTDIRTSIYAQCPGWELISSDIDNFLVGKLYPLITTDNWAKCFYHDGEAPPPTPGPGLDEHARERTEEMFDAKFRRMEAAYEGVISQDTSALLERTIRQLLDRGIRVLLLTPPYWHGYDERLDRARVETAQRLTDGICRRTGVPYLDYSRDSRFTFDPSMFHDADHLSDECVRRFVPLFMRDWAGMPATSQRSHSTGEKQ